MFGVGYKIIKVEHVGATIKLMSWKLNIKIVGC
jgi:hypothetical protein